MITAKFGTLSRQKQIKQVGLTAPNIWTHNLFVPKQTLNHLFKLGKWLMMCDEYLSVRYIWIYVFITLRKRFRVILYSCLNVKVLLAGNKCDILYKWQQRDKKTFEQGVWVLWHSDNMQCRFTLIRLLQNNNIQSKPMYR